MQVLRLKAERAGEVAEIIAFLSAVEGVYNNLIAFELAVGDAKERYGETVNERYWGRSRGKTARTVRAIKDPSSVVLPEERIRIHRVSVRSPGFWEFAGSLNPLEVLRKYAADRHERMKDESYRNAAEAERLRLENEKLKTDVVRDQIKLLRDLGIPEDRIVALLNRHLVAPLSDLDRFQDQGLFEDASLAEVEDRKSGPA